MSKYVIIDNNNTVIQVQPHNKYNLTKKESIIEVQDSMVVICGQKYNKTKKTFVNPIVRKTNKQKIKEIDQATQKKIFDRYSDNKQRTLLMRAMGGDTAEFQEMTEFVQACLAEGQAKKDKL